MSNNSMLGKWDSWYKDIKEPTHHKYGNTKTYHYAAGFLVDMPVIEDWGCGTGGLRRYRKTGYVGVDGSKNPFVDVVADLREYTSDVDGIVLRHVLEHNYDWKMVLQNALKSAKKKLCIIIFTPFAAETKEIGHNAKHGVDVPDLSFNQKELESFFEGTQWRMETYQTKTFYGEEHVYYISKEHTIV